MSVPSTGLYGVFLCGLIQFGAAYALHRDCCACAELRSRMRKELGFD